MSNVGQQRRAATRTTDFIESLDSFEAAVHEMKAAAAEAMCNLASVYYHSRGKDRVNTEMLLEEMGKVSDAVEVIKGILTLQLRPHEEEK